MSVLTDLRTDVVDSLQAAGLQVESHIPADVEPPLVLIEFGSPYLEPGGTFHETQVNLVLRCVVASADNLTVTNDLDDMLETVISNLADWELVAVDPQMYQANDNVYLSAAVQISNTIQL